jgi:hypothetical protein
MDATTKSFSARAAWTSDKWPAKIQEKLNCEQQRHTLSAPSAQLHMGIETPSDEPSWRAPIVGTKPTFADGSSALRKERIDSTVRCKTREDLERAIADDMFKGESEFIQI